MTKREDVKMTTRKPKLRFLSALLAVAMLMTLIPAGAVTAWADDADAVTEFVVKDNDEFQAAVAKINAAESGEFVIKLADDIVLEGDTKLTKNTITILGEGYTLGGGPNVALGVSNGAILNLGQDGYKKTLTFDNENNYCTGPLVGVSSGAKLNVYDGTTLQNNQGMGTSGGIQVEGTNSVATMYGGKIDNCSSPVAHGGGVSVKLHATFTMKDGTISNCSAVWGGGVSANCGNILISGGTIENNKATYGGGLAALYLGNTASYPYKLIITGGTIQNNTAESFGGGIMLYSSNTAETIENCTITGNKASYGGGISLYNGSNMDVSGTGNVICNNTATSAGADVFLNKDVDSITLPSAAAMNRTYGTSGKKIDGWYKDNPSYTPSETAQAVDVSGILKGQLILVASYKITKYTITLPDGSTAEIGDDPVDKAEQNDKVTVVVPDADAVYELVKEDGTKETLTDKDADGNYIFTMPDGDVTIRRLNNLHINADGEAVTKDTYKETDNDGTITYYGNGWEFDGKTLTITADQNLTKENPVEVPVEIKNGKVEGGIFTENVTVANGADLNNAVVYGKLTGNDNANTHLLTTTPKNCVVVPEGYTGGAAVQTVARSASVLNYTGKVYVVGDRTLTVAWPEGTTKKHWTATDENGDPVELAKNSFDSATKILTVDMSKYSVLNLILAADPKNDLKVEDFDFADGKLTLKDTIEGAGEPSVVYRKVNGNTLGDEKLTSLKDAEAGLYQLEVNVPEGEDYNAATLTSESWRVYVSANLTPAEKIFYKITVKNGTTDVVEAQKGTLIKLFADKAPEGEEFDYWQVNGEKIEGDSFEMPAKDVTAEAHYKAKTYSVVFVTAHDTAPNSLTVKHGETISGDRVLKADGYEFGGWYNGNEKFVFGENGTKVTSNLTLTAKWTEVKKPDPTPGDDKPTTPEEPDKPSTPDTPDKPSEPEKPDTPNKPDQPSEPDKPSTPETPEKPDQPDTPDKPSEPEEPEPVTYTISIDNGKAYLEEIEINKAEAGQTVTIKVNPEAITEGFEFDKWKVVSGDVKLADETALETTFEMPASDVELKATVKVKEVPAVVPAAVNPASVVAGTVVLVVGAVSVGWSAYNIATELYLKWVLPQGIIPTTRGQLALLLWDKAEQPAAESTTVYSDIPADDTDEQTAARWVIETGKMELLDGDEEDVFEPDTPVDIFAVAKAWRKK